MVDVAIVRSHNILYDSRVRKIAESINKKYSVFVLGWDRRGISKKNISDNLMKFKLFSLQAPIGRPSLIWYLPFFWSWVFIKLVTLRPQVVHACDLDTVIPCSLYKTIFGKKLVFDVFDRYAMANIPQKNKFLYSFVTTLEESYSEHADVLITVGKNVLRTFKRKPKYFEIIMNTSEDHPMKKDNHEKNLLTLVYTGAIVRNRGIEQVTAVIKDVEGVELVVAGWVIDNELLNELMKMPNVKYVGLLEPADALTLEGNSDVMVILYDLKIQNHNFANPSKTFEAMMLGLPIITNVTHDIIKDAEFGIIVNYEDLDQIKSAIISLRDNAEIRKRLGENGRKAFERKYDWKMMEQKLYKIYDGLLKQTSS